MKTAVFSAIILLMTLGAAPTSRPALTPFEADATLTPDTPLTNSSWPV
jgi:hypothetical protein